MKTLNISLAITDTEAELLLSKYSTKEIEGFMSRESYHVLNSLVNEIKLTIPYIESIPKEELFND